jgi:hypothetical protein
MDEESKSDAGCPAVSALVDYFVNIVSHASQLIGLLLGPFRIYALDGERRAQRIRDQTNGRQP